MGMSNAQIKNAKPTDKQYKLSDHSEHEILELWLKPLDLTRHEYTPTIW